MDDFWLDVFLMSLPFLIILAAVYLPVIKGRLNAVKRQRQKIVEYEDQLKKAGTVIANLERDVLYLRRELKKRTDQYNDLVDLAREHNII